MDDFLEAFALYEREERGLRATTVDRYQRGAAEFVSFLAQHYPQLVDPRQVEKDHVVAFLRAASTKRAASWNVNLAALRAFFEFLEHLAAIEISPTIGIARMHSLPRDVVPLSFAEFMRLLEAVEQAPGLFYRRRNRLIILVLFFGAVRVSELVSLDLDQVDLQARVFINVRRKRGRRISSPFNDLIAEAIEQYLEVRDELDLAAHEPALLVSDRRKRISVRTVQDLVKHYAVLAGIKRPIYPHLLRHSSASHLAASGTPGSVIQEHLGHRSITTTQRYIHAGHDARKKAVDRLSKAFNDHLAGLEEGDADRT